MGSLAAVESWWSARVGGGRWSRPAVRRWTADLLLWVTTAAPIGYAGVTPPHSGHATALTVGALLLLAVAVAVSRRWPVAALVVVVLGSLLDGNFLFAIPVFSYLTGRRSATAVPAAVAFGVLAAGGTVLNLGLFGTGAATWFLLASVLLFAGVFPWLVGRYRRQQAVLADAGRRHAEARDRERRGTAERIRLRERARIAQEMHDSLGHDLSLIALRAAALEVAGDLAPGTGSPPGSCGPASPPPPNGCTGSSGCSGSRTARRAPGRPTRVSPSWSTGPGRRAWRCAWTARTPWRSCHRWPRTPHTGWSGRR